jgi:chlorobactene glucosyltransferase
MITILTWLLFFALFYLLITSVILLRNRFDLTSLPVSDMYDPGKTSISVCIPARNEEHNIGKLLQSIVNQDWPYYDIHILDDHSEDKTFQVAQSFQKQYPEKMYLIKGKEKPKNWLGKPWACQQLGRACSGEIVLFLDADTELYPQTLTAVAAAFEKYQTDMITVWPQQKTETFWEKTIIPLVYYALVTLLPAIYVHRNPKWMPSFLTKKFKALFAAACGQCIAFRREAYQKIGRHESVKASIVEDVELAKIVKKSGLKMRMFHGAGTVSCRMYQNEEEIFEGLRKNFLAGFNNSLPRFILAMIVHLVVFILPFFSVLYSVFAGHATLFFLSAGCIGLILLHRLILAIWFRWDPLYSFTHPIGVLWFQRLGIVKLVDHFTRKKVEWKGRKV